MILRVLPDLASLAAVAELYPLALPSTFGLLRLMLRRNGDVELPDGDVIFKCGAELPDGRTCGKTFTSYARLRLRQTHSKHHARGSGMMPFPCESDLPDLPDMYDMPDLPDLDARGKPSFQLRKFGLSRIARW